MFNHLPTDVQMCSERFTSPTLAAQIPAMRRSLAQPTLLRSLALLRIPDTTLPCACPSLSPRPPDITQVEG